MSFNNLGLNESLLKNVRRSGYKDPTPIQRETIPLVLAGRDAPGRKMLGTRKESGR